MSDQSSSLSTLQSRYLTNTGAGSPNAPSVYDIIPAQRITCWLRYDLAGFIFTNNSPGAGSVAWSEGDFVYEGTTYHVVSGSGTGQYVWWQYSNPYVFQTTSIYPTLGPHDFIIGVNTAGSFKLFRGAYDDIPQVTVVPPLYSYATQTLSSQTAANNAFTTLTFDTNMVDAGGLHSTSSFPTRFTVPAGGKGLYDVSGLTCFDVNVGDRILVFNVNGAGLFALSSSSALASNPTFLSGSMKKVLNVGDYVEFLVYQNSGVVLSILGFSGSLLCGLIRLVAL